jgi:hypothetical protein
VDRFVLRGPCSTEPRHQEACHVTGTEHSLCRRVSWLFMRFAGRGIIIILLNGLTDMNAEWPVVVLSVTVPADGSFEYVAKFRYLRTTSTDQNHMHEEIKSRLNSGNACYHSFQSLLSSRLLSRNLKLKCKKP